MNPPPQHPRQKSIFRLVLGALIAVIAVVIVLIVLIFVGGNDGSSTYQTATSIRQTNDAIMTAFNETAMAEKTVMEPAVRATWDSIQTQERYLTQTAGVSVAQTAQPHP